MKLANKRFHIIILLCSIVLLVSGCNSKTEENAENFLTELRSQESILNAEEVKLAVDGTEGFKVKTYFVCYQNGECTVEAYISVPKKYFRKQGQYPFMIYNRGGNRDYGINTPKDIAYLADTFGMMVVASQYRGAAGSTGEDEFGGRDVEDIIKLLDICESLTIIDMDKCYMLGASRGGMMTYQVISRDDRVDKAVVVSGIADVFDVYEKRHDMRSVLKELIGGTPKEVPEEYEKRSAVYFAKDILCPVLIIHSKQDEKVPYTEAENMVECLEEASMEYKFVVYEDDVHGFHPKDFGIIKKWLD